MNVPIELNEGDFSKATAEKNARLIAAAPDLLAALERCLAYGDLLAELETEAKNAIAKAKGDSA